MSEKPININRIEEFLAEVMNIGTLLASVVIALGLVRQALPLSAAFPSGPQIVTVGIGLFIFLPILRVILMLILFLKDRDYLLAATAAAVFVIILTGLVIGARFH